VIAISLPPARCNWSTLSFSSTLYLCPILDLLLANIPDYLEPEIRLGLQEALVNAAKHGNQLDPKKSVIVQFSISKNGYTWVISNEGRGFTPNTNRCDPCSTLELPPEESENGRGLCILHQIFDRVSWNNRGRQLYLSKQTPTSRFRWSLNERF
jgi:serine/threonine-protein kinase RsbW